MNRSLLVCTLLTVAAMGACKKDPPPPVAADAPAPPAPTGPPPGSDGAKSGGYLEKEPVDPWNRPYVYLNPGVHGEVDVFSYGADGAPGGEGAAADIGSWSL